MGKKHKQLLDKVASPDNLWRAYRAATRGKRLSGGYLAFRQAEASHIAALSQSLLNGTYRPQEPRQFMVFEPKPRRIAAPVFTDRVVQHALYQVIAPIFDKVFLPQSYACRHGKGAHRAAKAIQARMRRAVKSGAEPYFLKTDFSQYFASIDRHILHREIARKVSCARTRALIALFIPPEGVGIPIGHLVSQLAANIYGHILDRWLVHDVGVSRFARYMDDVVVVGHSREAMELLQVRMAMFIEVHMRLRFSHWQIGKVVAGVNFVGYRLWPSYKLISKPSVRRARRRLRAMPSSVARDRYFQAWQAHARHADSYHLRRTLGAIYANFSTRPQSR